VSYIRPAWRGAVPTYREVRYRSVWPGVGVAVHSRRGPLEYDFRLAPGADPGRIRLGLSGTRRVELSASGALVAHTPAGVLRQAAPKAYQLVGGRRRAVPSAWTLAADHVAGVRVGRFDRTRPLVIDPTLTYSSYLGGTGDEFAQAVRSDAQGNFYVAGITSSTDLPVSAGAFQGTNNGGAFNGYDAFVAKLDPSGQRIWTTYLGGTNDDEAYGVAVDPSGNVYVAGVTFSGNFPTTAGSLKPSFVPASNSGNGFVTKLNSAGSAEVYSTYLGGANAGALDIAVDGSGSAYVTGNTGTADFPVTAGAAQGAYAGTSGGFNTNTFVARLKADGSGPLLYGTYLGGGTSGGSGLTNVGNGIAIDGAGNAFVTGSTNATHFPLSPGPLQATRTRAANGFATKVNSSGTAFTYSTYLPQDDGQAVAASPAGSAYVTGKDAGQAYVARLDAAGSAFSFARALGPGQGNGLALDATGNAVVVGQASAGFPTTADAHQPSFGGGFSDAFLAWVNAAGSPLYTSLLGGSGVDLARSVALGPGGAALLTGDSDSSNLPTVGARQAANAGGSDAILARFQLVDPTPAAPTTPAERLPPPVLGAKVNVAPVSGKVFVSVAGGAARAAAHGRAGVKVPGVKGRDFVLLTGARQIPVGSFLDTRRGKVRLQSARDRKGTTQLGDFNSGVFQVRQSGKAAAKGLTELRMKGSSFARCAVAKRGKRASASRRRSKRSIRRVGGNAKGNFRTRGRYSAATVRGTVWTVTDRCDGTLTTVRSGTVAVRDVRRRKTILVRSGKRYLARAP